MITYHYYRYGAPFSRTFDTAKEALRRAMTDFDFNEAYPESIVDGDGKVLYDHAAIVNAAFDDDSEDE